MEDLVEAFKTVIAFVEQKAPRVEKGLGVILRSAWHEGRVVYIPDQTISSIHNEWMSADHIAAMVAGWYPGLANKSQSAVLVCPRDQEGIDIIVAFSVFTSGRDRLFLSIFTVYPERQKLTISPLGALDDKAEVFLWKQWFNQGEDVMDEEERTGDYTKMARAGLSYLFDKLVARPD